MPTSRPSDLHPSRPTPTHDEDPFARLTDDDLHHLRHHPHELAEELRFGSYWSAHAEGGSLVGHACALALAAEVIERLASAQDPVDPTATTDPTATATATATAALRLADAALASRRPPAAAAGLREHVEAFASWSERLDHELDELRVVLDAHETGTPPARRAAQPPG